MRTAIDIGENVNAILGGTTTLGWAIAFADAAVAHLLIDNGVDVHYPEHGMETVLIHVLPVETLLTPMLHR